MSNEMQDGFDRLWLKIDQTFQLVDKRFDGVDARFDRMDTRLDRMDARFDRIDGQLTAVRAELHRHGVLLDEHGKELKLAVRTFETLHDLERERLDIARDSLDKRLTYVERMTGLSTESA